MLEYGTPSNIPTPADVQRHLETLGETSFENALTWLETASRRWGYLTPSHLEDNVRHLFYDSETGVDFRFQINRARSRYAVQLPPLPPGAQCRICAENVGSPTKENLRIFRFDLAGREFFFQWTPFPLFPFHGVVIQSQHSPMRMDRQVLDDGVAFLGLAPSYTFFSNSDRALTGASILGHLHYQVAANRSLPVMEASVRERVNLGAVWLEHLNFPMSALRLTGPTHQSLTGVAEKIIDYWRGRDPKHNSLNLAWRNTPRGDSELTLLFRSQLNTPSEALSRYKTEGIGVIEAGGEFIFPVPAGENAPSILAELDTNGREIIKSFLRGIDPWSDPTAVMSEIKRLFEPLNSATVTLL